MTKQRHTAYGALIIAEVIWGALLVIAKPALQSVSAQEFLFLRYLIAIPFIIPILIRVIKEHSFPVKSLKAMAIHEFFCGLNLLLLYIALGTVSALQASLLITIRPIFITIAGLFLLNEHEEKHELIGLLLATIGATLVASNQLAGSQSLTMNLMTGLLLITNIFDALLTVNFKKRLSHLPIKSLDLFHVLFSTCLFGLINLSSIPHTLHTAATNPTVLFGAIFAGLFGSVIAVFLSIYGISHIEISEATLFSYLKPLVFIPLAIILLGEQIDVLQISGLVLIFSGVFLAETRHPTHWLSKHFIASHRHHIYSYHLRH